MFLADGDRRQSTREGIEAVLKIWTDPEPGHYKTDFWEFKIPEDRPNIVSVHMKPYQKPHPPIAMAGSSPKSDTLVLAVSAVGSR